MKEAAGEANMTVITIVLIAIVLAVGTLIVRSMMSNTRKSSACTACGGYWKGGQCTTYDGTSFVEYEECMTDGSDVNI